MSNQENESSVKLIPVTEWSKHHTYPRIGGLRFLIFRCPPGFEKVVVRVGRRVLINESEFFKWASTNPTTNKMEVKHGK